jgi:hypothetical protein
MDHARDRACAAPPGVQADTEALRLIARQGRLHALRSGLGIAATLLFLPLCGALAARLRQVR